MKSKLWQLSLIIVLVSFSQCAMAFGCTPYIWGNRDVYFDPVRDVPKVGDVKTLIDFSTITCSGNAYDAVRVSGFNKLFHPDWSSFGVRLFFTDH